MPCDYNADLKQSDLSKSLFNEDKATLPLIPIVYSHALGGQNVKNTGYMLEMASHGYIVFALDHLDGSNEYTRL